METMLINSLTVSFRINRLIEDRLYASTCDISLDLDFEVDVAANTHKERLTIMRRWISEILDNSIAFNVQSTVNTALFGQVANHLMFCPDEPHDHILLLLIAAKLNAIGAGTVIVSSGTISSDTNMGFGNSLIGDPLDMLPSATDWMGEVRYWPEPWWNRPDGGMMDIPVSKDDDPNVKPDLLIDMQSNGVKLYSKTRDEDVVVIADDDEKIIRPNFKPRS